MEQEAKSAAPLSTKSVLTLPSLEWFLAILLSPEAAAAAGRCPQPVSLLCKLLTELLKDGGGEVGTGGGLEPGGGKTLGPGDTTTDDWGMLSVEEH